MATQAELDILLRSPAIPPPPGVTPNLVDPPVYWFNIWVLTASFSIAIATFSVMIRIYTRLYVSRTRAWEDYLMFLAWVLYVPHVLVDLFAFRVGAGVHLWNLSLRNYSRWALLVFVKELSNTPATYVTKISLLLQIEHIFAPIHSGLAYWSTQAVIWLNTLYYTACILATIFQCSPVGKAWQPWLAGRCSNVAVGNLASSLINVVSDLLIFAIPLLCVSRLRMPTAQKLAVVAVFAVGVFTCVMSIMRTVTSVKLAGRTDHSYGIVPLVIWTNAELAGGITCGCMPAMPQFFRHLALKIKSIFGSHDQSRKSRFSIIKNSLIPPKRGKVPDPYEDLCNVTDVYDLDSTATFATEVEKLDATFSTSERPRNDRDHPARDLESTLPR